MAAAIAARSPSSSPRLPSPPPMAEDQAGPLSPLSPPREHPDFTEQTRPDQASSRKIRPGTKSADMNEGPPLVELADIDSAFQLTEHLKALHYSYTHPAQSNTTQPITRSTASLLATVPAGIERSLWLYEICRFLVQKINVTITSLFTDSCSAASCPEMRASEWQYLCAVHDPPKSCCAIDYCCHTLDWAANTLTSPKFFPSRLSLGVESGSQQSGTTQGVTRQHQERQLTNVFRRVYRIFAHAWYSHKGEFWRVEGQTGLYVLFKTVCDSYALIPDENYTIPPEAEGLPSKNELPESPQFATDQQKAQPSGILKRDSEPQGQADTGATARRHRHAPSRSGSTVTTVIEENEDEEGGNATSRHQQQSVNQFPEPPTLSPSKTVFHENFVDEPDPILPKAPPEKPLPTLSTSVYKPSSPSKVSPPKVNTSSSLEPTAAGYQAPSSHSTVSPTSPLAMTSAEIAAAEEQGFSVRRSTGMASSTTASSQSNVTTPATSGPPANDDQKPEHTEQITESEDAAKAALTKAEGLQASTTDAADPEAAEKTVDD